MIQFDSSVWPVRAMGAMQLWRSIIVYQHPRTDRHMVMTVETNFSIFNRKNENWRLKNQFMQEWQSEFRSMTSCDIYVEFKHQLKLEKNMLHGNKKYRWAIGNLRMNNTIIAEVIWGYKGLDRNQRIYNDNCLEDEIIFLFECKNTTMLT